MKRKIEIEYVGNDQDPVVDSTNRVLATFGTFPKQDWSEVLYLVSRYFEGMNILPRPPADTQ